MVGLSEKLQSYYLKSLFGGDALSTLLHIHGLVMTLWILLFMLQVRLIFILKNLCVLAYVMVDVASTRRLHPATGWSFLLIVVSYPVTRVIGALPAWIDLARWLVN